MVSQELITFMRAQFGNQCLKLLNNIHQNLGVEDIEEASIEDKKNFILELQPFLREKSVTRSEVLISELMSILSVNLQEPTYSHIGLKREHKSHIQAYIALEGERKINTVLEEMNTLIKLYMRNTDKAIKKGVNDKEIMRMTRKVLDGLKTKIFSIAQDIENKYNIKTDLDVIRRRVKDLEARGDYVNEEELTHQMKLAEALGTYNARMERVFLRYRDAFLKNLKAKLYLERSNIPGDHLIKRTEQLSESVFDQVQLAYEGLKRNVNKT